jgi:hypothetical protein
MNLAMSISLFECSQNDTSHAVGIRLNRAGSRTAGRFSRDQARSLASPSAIGPMWFGIRVDGSYRRSITERTRMTNSVIFNFFPNESMGQDSQIERCWSASDQQFLNMHDASDDFLNVKSSPDFWQSIYLSDFYQCHLSRKSFLFCRSGHFHSQISSNWIFDIWSEITQNGVTIVSHKIFKSAEDQNFLIVESFPHSSHSSHSSHGFSSPRP